MNDINYSKIKIFGILSSNTKACFEFGLVKWGEYEPKYDLRKWAEDGTIPYKGASYSENEILKIYKILKHAIIVEKSSIPLYEGKSGKFKVQIYNNFGEYKSNSTMKGLVTYSSWGGAPKYDVRMWQEDFQKCSKGITLNEQECIQFLELCKNIFESNNDVVDFDTSDIDVALFV